MHGGEEKCIQGFGGKCKEKKLLEDLGLWWRIMLYWVFKKENGTGFMWRRVGAGSSLLWLC
jgi:hypothetical protein